MDADKADDVLCELMRRMFGGTWQSSTTPARITYLYDRIGEIRQWIKDRPVPPSPTPMPMPPPLEPRPCLAAMLALVVTMLKPDCPYRPALDRCREDLLTGQATVEMAVELLRLVERERQHWVNQDQLGTAIRMLSALSSTS